MARTDSNALLKGFSGAIGKQIVVKQYGDKTVISKYPDMGKRKASANQKVRRGVFQDAVAYAQSILRSPAKKAAYAKKLPEGQLVYHGAISEYMKKNIKESEFKAKRRKR
jgi:hypothetical protein